MKQNRNTMYTVNYNAYTHFLVKKEFQFPLEIFKGKGVVKMLFIPFTYMYFFSRVVKIYFILILPDKLQKKQTIVQIDTDGESTLLRPTST